MKKLTTAQFQTPAIPYQSGERVCCKGFPLIKQAQSRSGLKKSIKNEVELNILTIIEYLCANFT
jgi:hypothetical protein